MKVAYLTAGAAGMYCGSCLNDNTLARTLGRRGVDVALIPTYTPIRTDEEDVSIDRVFLGGINVYLQQKFALFRHTPRFVDKLLNSKPMLKLAARLSGSTDAKMLGEMTLAVLAGDHGPLRKEVDKLVVWLKDDFQPDVVHLTNAMFAGLAAPLKAHLGVPVTCGLPGEDLFLDALREPYRGQALTALREAARHVDAFTAPSPYYRSHMAAYMDVPEDRIHVVGLGLDHADDLPEPQPRDGAMPFHIGFLARRAPEKGLHHLVDAFLHLAERAGRGRVRLKVAGYLSPQDRTWYEGLEARVHAAGASADVTWVGEVDGAGKRAFFSDLHAFSMPAPYREPKGRSVLEAMAHGVPVVQPDHGAFSHMLAVTGGGLLVTPGEVPALVDGLATLMEDEPRRHALALAGRDNVRRRYSAAETAAAMEAVWRGCVARA